MSEIAKQNADIFHAPLVLPEPSLLGVISRAASDPNCDVGKMRELLAMHKELAAGEAAQAYSRAMAAAQAEMGRIAADATNPQTKSKYASYAALDRVLRPIYTKHGFALSFDTGEAAENMVRVLAYVEHGAGHTRTFKIDMPADGKGAKGGDVMSRTHATGAAITYGQRYLLKAIFNIAIGIDDDNGAEGMTSGLDATQLQHIEDLIAKLPPAGRNDTALFCQHFSIGAPDELLKKDYTRAVEMLQSTRLDREAKAKK